MATTTAGAFPIGKENSREQPNKGFLGARQNSDQSHLEENMPPRRQVSDVDDEFAERERMHVLMLTNTSMCKAIEAMATQAVAAPKTNGNSQRNTIIAALLIAFIPQAFGVVWWTRGTEKETDKRVNILELKLEQAEKHDTLRERDIRLLQQYNMNLQLWLRDRGVKGVPQPPKIEERGN